MKNKPAEVAEEPAKATAKRILYSKTIWVNLIAFIAFALEKKFGFPISYELQMEALSLINIALRFVTKEAIVWGGEKENGNPEENS